MRGLKFLVPCLAGLGILFFFIGTVLAVDGSDGGRTPQDPSGPNPGGLSLAEVLVRVLEKNPELGVAAGEIEALQGRIRQAGLRPNPSLDTLVENVAGTGEMGWIHSAETTIQVQIPLERASKRRTRVQSAVWEKDLAVKESEVLRAEVVAGAVGAFAEVLACQERRKNRKELLELAERIDQTVTGRVSAGKVSPIEAYRSQVTLQTARLEKEKADQALVSARQYLSSFWMGSGAEIPNVLGSFRLPPAAVVQNNGGSGIHGNPQWEMADVRIEAQKGAIALETAAARPDPVLTAGFRRLTPLGESALVAGVSFPLPFFDRRQGAIAEARSRVEKARREKTALENRLTTILRLRQESAGSTFREAAALRDQILPQAEEALLRLQEGYRQGKFDFLPVLDAQRTYAELKGRYVDVIEAAMKAAIEIQKLNGSIMTPGSLSYLDPEKKENHENQ